MTNEERMEAWKAEAIAQFKAQDLQRGLNGTTADDIQISGTHYKEMPIEPWKVMESVLTREEFIGFLKGNIIKYSMRAGRKAGSDDAGKALHYIQKLMEFR